MQEVRFLSTRVFVWPGIHAEVGENVRVLAPAARQAFIVTDRKCIPIAKRVALSLLQANFEVAGYAMYSGESRKTVGTVLGVYNKMARMRMERSCAFVTVGGGVVTELGTFVASTFRDGLRLFHVPTSLVAQVDSAIGGKSGINLREEKNLISTFYPATAVFSDPSLLETLPRKEFLSGLVEVVKYGMVREADLLASLEENIEGLESRKPLLLEDIVSRCASIKAAVEKSEQEGVEAVLDYGRTVGHAIEAAGFFRKVRTGDAMAVGMEAEALMAERMGVAPPGVPKAQNRILRLLDLPTRLRGLTADKLLEAMGLNKNAPGSRVRMALPQGVGDACQGVEVPVDVVEEGLRAVLLPGNRLRAVRPMSPA